MLISFLPLLTLVFHWVEYRVAPARQKLSARVTSRYFRPSSPVRNCRFSRSTI